ncbi:MAG: response regulator transcription factor [Chloroflexota bacterium]|nr:response regulator transcription factor [Chloroflexota bacterium]
MLSSTVRDIPVSSLTSREKEISLLVAQGHSNRTIAKMLCLSDKTVRNHITHILSKLQLKSRTQLACYAWQDGWVGKAEGKEET